MTNPLLYLFQKMWVYARGNRRNVVLYIGMSASAHLLSGLEPLIIGLLLNALQTGGVHPEAVPRLFFLLFLLVLLELSFWALHGPSRIMERRNAFIVRQNYKNFLLRGTMALPIEWHTDHHSGDTIDKIEKGTTALYNFSERTFSFIQGFITLAIAFFAMFYFDVWAGTVAFTMTVFTFFILTLFDRKLVSGYKIVNRMDNTISAKIFDALSNVTTVIILRVETLVLHTLGDFIQKPFHQFRKNSILDELKWFSAATCGRITVVTVVALYLLSHISTGTIMVGTIYILLGYANQIRETFFRFADLYNDTIRYRASVSNTEELSNEFRNNKLPGTKRLPKNWSTLSISGLSFSYHAEDGADLHLKDISLDLKKGDRIALIGESGGGKTTLLKIMRDLYHPKSLQLKMGNKIISSGFSDISNSISLIPQDPEIFATTIRENLTLGVEYPEMHLKTFTDMARFTSVVERLPKKLESSIVEKGVNLSGGEKQRLALARGLLASVDKDIILLDEPTSSVDFQNELDIFQNIFSAFPKKTIIASVHRLHLLSLFDAVYFFEDGKIIALGTFEQLKESSPAFQALWEKYIKTRDA